MTDIEQLNDIEQRVLAKAVARALEGSKPYGNNRINCSPKDRAALRRLAGDPHIEPVRKTMIEYRINKNTFTKLVTQARERLKVTP